jgi:hypothetical protein
MTDERLAEAEKMVAEALSSRDGIICGLREALENIEGITEVHRSDESEGIIKAVFKFAKEALSTAPECGHKEALEDETVEKVKLLSGLDNATNRIRELKEKLSEQVALVEEADNLKKRVSCACNGGECGLCRAAVKAYEAIREDAPTALAQHDEEVRREAFRDAARMVRKIGNYGQIAGWGYIAQELDALSKEFEVLAASRAGKWECPICKGSGHHPEGGKTTECEYCNGRGYVPGPSRAAEGKGEGKQP